MDKLRATKGSKWARKFVENWRKTCQKECRSQRHVKVMKTYLICNCICLCACTTNRACMEAFPLTGKSSTTHLVLGQITGELANISNGGIGQTPKKIINFAELSM